MHLTLASCFSKSNRTEENEAAAIEEKKRTKCYLIICENGFVIALSDVNIVQLC